MKKFYISTYNIAFDDYDLMKKWVREFPDFPLGVEYATSWTAKDFHEKLARQVENLKGIPATIHSPFIEICTVPGSPEEKTMEAAFYKACEYYHAFHATSMVFHTNESSFPQEERAAKRERTLEVLLRWNERLKKQGIAMTVENVGFPRKDNVLFDNSQFLHLFDQLPPEVGCLIDIGHAILNRWDIVSLIRTLGPRIRGYHLNNNDGIADVHYPQYDPEGYYTAEQVDEVIRAIARYSPEADLCLEYAPGKRVLQEGMYADIRRIVHITEEIASVR